MESKPSCSSQMPPRTDRSEDEETCSLSDYDSEWTQVSGTEYDSDFPPLTAASDRPLSRADTIDGSVDGDIWEGFIDTIYRSSSQSSDQTRPLDVDATDEVPQDAQPLSASTDSGPSDDELVNDALDSGFVGTLRASRARSVASSLHASLTESQSKLRLSFPDPLSSREDLDAVTAVQDISTPTSSVEEHCEIMEDASSFADTEPPLMPIVSVTVDETVEMNRYTSVLLPPSASCILSLFLYGSATSAKWQIAERTMKLVFPLHDSTRSFAEDGSCRIYYFDCVALDDTVHALEKKASVVHVYDRTSNSSELELYNVDDCAPSLAIILLPSHLPAALPRHRFYLPLIGPSPLDFGSTAPIISSTFSEEVMMDSAHYTWKKLDLPKEEIIVLDRQQPDAILDASVLESIDVTSASQAFSVMFSETKEAQVLSGDHRGLRLFTNKWYTLAFVAATLLAITVGGVQVRRVPTPTSAAANETSKAMSANITSSLGSGSAIAALVMSTDGLALTTQSFSRSLSTITSKTATRSPSSARCGSGSSRLTGDARKVASDVTVSSAAYPSSSKPSTCRSKARSWVDKLNLSLGEYLPRDLIVRPVDIIGAVNKKSFPKGGSSGDKSSSSGITSLSLRAVHNSLAVVSTTSKALTVMARKDMIVLYEALDELQHALGRQMNTAKDEMKDVKSLVQINFSFRNGRAKENARRLRHVGEHFIKVAGNHLRSRGEEAIHMAGQVCDNARAIRQDGINSRQSRRSRRRKGSLHQPETNGEDRGEADEKNENGQRKSKHRALRNR